MTRTSALSIALATSLIAACFHMPGTQPAPGLPSGATQPAAGSSLLGGGMMTAVNSLTIPVCRVVIFSAAHHASYVNQEGPHSPTRGDLTPTEKPFLAPRGEAFVFFPDVPRSGATEHMVVTAFGCLRTEHPLGQYVTDERTQVFEKTLAIEPNGKLVIGG